jgi:hypothetical protein
MNTNSRPSIIVHPGFAKCATTTLQRKFQEKDYSLSKECGVVWLGREFKPFNGAPPVYDVVKGQDFVRQKLLNTSFDSNAEFFVSAENLVNHEDVLEAIAEVFHLRKVVFTVRLPLFIALSEYYFRAWLRSTVECAIEDGMFLLQKRLARKIDRFKSQLKVDVWMCPIEQKDYIGDFCVKSFGRSLEISGNGSSAKEISNKSADPCFVMAMQEEFKRVGRPELSQTKRRNLIRAVQAHETKCDTGKFLPIQVLQVLDNTPAIHGHITEYLGWLDSVGCSSSKINEVEVNLLEKVSSMLDKGPIPSDVQKKLAAEARALLGNEIV